MVDVTKVPSASMDIEAENIKQLKAIFPQCFSEGKLDVDKLLNMCGEYIDNDFEKYKFEWKGKSECHRIVGSRSKATLRPCVEESVDFDNTKNIYIEGDNLEVLKLLQQSYFRQIKMIYIDPPYNTGNDFVYEDDYTDPLGKYKEVTQQTTKSNPETMGRYHTKWLNMMYPRLRLAYNLLRDDGVIFISIDDNEVTNLRKLCDEVFGEENFVGLLPRVTKKAGKSTDNIALNHDYLIIYAKNTNLLKFNLQTHTDEGFKYTDEYVETRGKYKLNQTLDYDSLQYSPSLDYPLVLEGETFYPGGSIEKYNERKSGKYSRADWAWRWSQDLVNFGYKNGFIVIKKYDNYSRIYTKTYQNVSIEKTNQGFEIKQIERTKPLSSLEFTDNSFSNDNAKKQLSTLFESCPFDYSKPLSLIKFLVKFATNKEDIVLDFFSGSATTAQAVMQLNSEDNGNRKFIMVQLDEKCDEKSEAYKAGYKNICEIGKERIRRAGKKINGQSDNGQLSLEEKKKVDVGFKVFKLDTSNLVMWDSTPTEDIEQIQKNFDNMQNTVKTDRSDLDVVCEVMLKLGLPLDEKIIPVQVNDKQAYQIGEDSLEMICLNGGQKGLQIEDVEKMAEYLPEKIVIAEAAFSDDSVLSNAHYSLKDKEIEFELI